MSKRARRHPPIPSPYQGRTALLVPWGLGMVLFFIYLMTLCPTIPPGDGGMFIEVAHRLGVAHPPGYPLYTLLASFLSKVPLFSLAWRINLFSALAQAGAAALLCAWVNRWTQTLWAGILAAGAFAFSALAWRYAVIAEVFALHDLFVVLLFYLAFRFSEEPTPKWLYAGALAFGLGLSHHQTLIFYGLPTACWVLWRARLAKLLTAQRLMTCMLLGLTGFLPYLYLPWASAHTPLVTWGDQTNWGGFWKHFLRQEYGTFRLSAAPTQQSWWGALALYFKQLVSETMWVGLPLAAFGVYTQIKREGLHGFATLTLVCVGFYLIIFHAMGLMDFSVAINATVFERFYLMANVVVFAWLAVGAHTLLKNRNGMIGPALVAVALITQACLHWTAEDQSQTRSFEQLSEALLSPLPANALLLTRGDLHINVIRYAQESLNLRPDVKALDLELLKGDWFRRIRKKYFSDLQFPGEVITLDPQNRFHHLGLRKFTVRELVEANIRNRPVFFNLNDDGSSFRDLESQYMLIPLGLVRRVTPKTDPIDVDQLMLERKPFMEALQKITFRQRPPPRWEALVFNDTQDADGKFGNFILAQGIARKSPELLKRAGAFFDQYTQANPSRAFAYKNRGLAYWHLMTFEPAVRAKAIEAWTQYLKMPTDDKEAPAIRALLTKLTHEP